MPPSATARTRPTHVRTRSRRTRSATVASHGARNAAAAMRAAVTIPTAPTPPARNATMPRATMNALSLAQIAPNETCARPIGPLRDIARLSQNDETAHKSAVSECPRQESNLEPSD